MEFLELLTIPLIQLDLLRGIVFSKQAFCCKEGKQGPRALE